MIKVAPKMTLLNRSGSEQLVGIEHLGTFDEDRDIGHELIEDQPKSNKNRYSDPLSITDLSNKNSHGNKNDFSKTDVSDPKKWSEDKNEDETNASGQKLSLSSNEKLSQENRSCTSILHKKYFFFILSLF